MTFVLNADTFMTGLDHDVEEFERRFRLKMQRAMKFAMTKLISLTPVHTGRAVASYLASNTGMSIDAGPRAAVEATNQLPVGAERLRSSAARTAKATLANVSYDNPYQSYFISNGAPHISGLEAGELPLEPYTPRSPAGMFRVTLVALHAAFESGRF